MIISEHLKKNNIIINTQSSNRWDLFDEILDLAIKNKEIKSENRETIKKALVDREKSMSTGMQYGIAIPHGKTDVVEKMVIAIGIKKDGIDFQSADGLPSKIFIMLLSPAGISGPHIQFLANIGKLLNNEKTRDKIISARSREEVVSIFTGR